MPGSTGLQCVHHCRPLCRVDGSPGLYPTTMMQIISCAKALGEQITLKKKKLKLITISCLYFNLITMINTDHSFDLITEAREETVPPVQLLCTVSITQNLCGIILNKEFPDL